MSAENLVRAELKKRGLDVPEALITFAVEKATALVESRKSMLPKIINNDQARTYANILMTSLPFKQACASALANAERFSSKFKNIA